MEKFEYIRIKIDDISQEIIDEYQLQNFVHNGRGYIEIRKGAYGLPQSGVLAYTKLSKVLNVAGYHEAITTPGLRTHQWRPIMFTLVVDDFSIEYVDKEYIKYLMQTLKPHYDLTANWNGTKFLGIDLE